MKKITPFAAIAVAFISCHPAPKKIVDPARIDSFITHYTDPAIAQQNREEMAFWKKRINPQSPGFVNEGRYAGTLVSRFHLFGDIADLYQADSILKKIDCDFNGKEAGPNLAMVSHCISEHRFQQADSFLQKAKQTGLKKYESLTSSFDVNFELGRYNEAKFALDSLASAHDYGYYFRKSKMDHLDGNIDSAVESMMMAAQMASNNTFLRNAALSNAADLDIHSGELGQAGKLYLECINSNSADFHSLMGIAWIALVNDKNDSLAQKINEFVLSKYQLPDPLYKLAQIKEATGDTISQTAYAKAFAIKATRGRYGRMYNKYLVELYTGILHNPGRAEAIALDELNNRATPQTYAWYAWTLAANNKPDAAYEVFQKHVSGKPLESLELFWMGRMMEQLGKAYNAIEFYKAAEKNKYDLSPAIASYIHLKLS